jgi:hypothetical protein
MTPGERRDRTRARKLLDALEHIRPGGEFRGPVPLSMEEAALRLAHLEAHVELLQARAHDHLEGTDDDVEDA